MINTLITLLIILATNGDICEAGTALDWYPWQAEHPDYTEHVTAQVVLPGVADFFTAEVDGQTILFVFRDDGSTHGRCARVVN